MPQLGKCWRHCIIGTRGSWLPGDPRGWRSRGHKRHSSGDYKRPPPEGEHAGLYAFSKKQRDDTVVIPQSIRPIIGARFRDELINQNHRVLVIAVGGKHCHFLAELPVDKNLMQSFVGHAKRHSSRAVKQQMPGSVWAAGGKFIIIDNEAYQKNVFEYILRHAEEGAWVWTYRDGV